MYINRDSSSVIFHGNGSVLVENNYYLCAVSCKGLVNRVVHYFINQVVKTPFSNISGAPEDAWIAAGISATLVAELERGGDLTAVGRQTVSGAPPDVGAAPDANTGPPEIAAGRRLGARWVISGGYQRLRERMRISLGKMRKSERFGTFETSLRL